MNGMAKPKRLNLRDKAVLHALVDLGGSATGAEIEAYLHWTVGATQILHRLRGKSPLGEDGILRYLVEQDATVSPHVWRVTRWGREVERGEG